MTRYELLKSVFGKKNLFKIVCGAGNEDPEEVRRLTKVYTLAGAGMVDVSANVDVVKACVRGIDEAFDIAPSLDRQIPFRPFINVSVGIKGDPHVRKARIDKTLCIECGLCAGVCEQEAISGDNEIIEYRCIGCGSCAKVCESEAITFEHKKVEFQDILPRVLDAGAENLELHATVFDDEPVMKDWAYINSLVPGNYISVCLDRTLLSNTHLVERVRNIYNISGDRTIVQADGDPMSGGRDDFNTTLQAVSCADIVAKSKLPVAILASGGTNSRTRELAELCGIPVHGVSIGTFARSLIRAELTGPGLDNDIGVLKSALAKAETLVRQNSR